MNFQNPLLIKKTFSAAQFSHFRFFGPWPLNRARRDIQFWGVNFSIWTKIDWVMAISSFRLTNCIITSLYRRFCPITAPLSAPFLTVNNFEAHSIHPSHKIPKLGVLVHWPPVSVRRSNLIGSLSKSCILIGRHSIWRHQDDNFYKRFLQNFRYFAVVMLQCDVNISRHFIESTTRWNLYLVCLDYSG